MRSLSALVLAATVAACAAPAPARTAAPEVAPDAGTWKTWVLGSGSQLRLPAPPDKTATDAEVKQLQALAAQRDSAALDLINTWDVGGPGFRWNEIVTELITKNKMSTPSSARVRVLVNVALYDAMVAAWDSKFAYRRSRPTDVQPTLTTVVPSPRIPSYPSEHAVAAGAASAVLSYLFPADAKVFEDRADQAARSRLLAGVSFPSDVARGLELGRAVGALVVNHAKRDGSDAKFAGTIPNEPGKWKGTDPQEPAAATWKTWILSSSGQLDPGPPPAFGSAQLEAELKEVKDFVRTQDSNQAAFFWNAKGGQFWHDLVNKQILDNRLDQDPPRAARVYALVNVAAYDATIAAWWVKYKYWAARPVQLDPTITTLFPTPSHPSYPSTNAASWGATATMLAYLFPGDAAYFMKQAEEGAVFPFWAGIHFRRDTDVGRTLGTRVAAIVIERAKADGVR